MTTYSPKDPTDVRRYEYDLTAALPTGATITDVTGVTMTGGMVAPEDVDPAYGVVDGAPTTVYAWASGGTVGSAAITWTLTTSGGETLQRTATLTIKER